MGNVSILYCYTHIPCFYNRYRLFGLTFWSVGHYRGAVTINGTWNYYDGLWERHNKRDSKNVQHMSHLLPLAFSCPTVSILHQIFHSGWT